MPYRIPNPDDAPPPTEPSTPGPIIDAGVRELVEQGEVLPQLKTTLAELWPTISSSAAEEAEAAETAVMGQAEAGAIRGAGPAFRDAWLEYGTEDARAGQDPNLSARGRQERRARAAEARDQQVERIAEEVLGRGGDALLARFPAPALGQASPDVYAEAQTIFAAYPHLTPGQLAQDVVATLRRALDTTAPMEARFRANVLLRKAYLPLTQRRAERPERYALDFAVFNAELAEAIKLHLDTVTRAERHRVASEFVQAARDQFTFLVNSVAEAGGWDGVWAVGAPIFEW